MNSFNSLKDLIKRYRWLLAGLAVAGALLLWGPTVYAKLATRSQRYDLMHISVQKVPHRHVGIVFGAGLYDGDKPTSYLRVRMEAAAKLYETKRVDKLLLTGDNSRSSYNEPEAMRKLAIKLGVPKEDITLDYAGRNTYDSCYRARVIFKVRQATLITQGYHLPRALMTCRGLGIDAVGVAATHKTRDYTDNYILREWFSTDKTVLQLIFKPKPALLGAPLPIR